MRRLLAPPARGPRDWAEAATMLAAVVAVAWICGRASGLLPPVEPNSDAATLGRAAVAFVAPAALEEAVFRAPLLWPGLHRPTVAAALLAAYVTYHLAGALLRPELAWVLADPLFLTLATCLGLACTVSAWRSQSLCPPIMLHWAVVAGWIVLFGGLHPVQA